MKKTLLTICSLLVTSQVYAISCPDITSPQNASAALDSALSFPAYLVYSSKSAFTYQEREWFMGLHVSASSKEEAILKAHEQVKTIDSHINRMAAQYQFLYFCAYGTTDGKVVMALSYDLMNAKLSPHDFLNK